MGRFIDGMRKCGGLYRLYVSGKRLAEKPAILTAELCRAFVADVNRGRGDIERFDEHQPARFLETKLLLILQGAHAGQRSEMMMQGRDPHVNSYC